MFKKFCDILCNDKPFITVEVTPPHGASVDGIIDEIETLGLHKKVTGFSCTDNPLAQLKMSGLLSAIKLQQRFDKPVIATMSMRDKNKLSLQSDLLGANDFDIRCKRPVAVAFNKPFWIASSDTGRTACNETKPAITVAALLSWKLPFNKG